MFIDIKASLESRKTLIDIISNAARDALMPLTVGGGIKTIEQIRQILASGADKVLITLQLMKIVILFWRQLNILDLKLLRGGIDYKLCEDKKIMFGHIVYKKD